MQVLEAEKCQLITHDDLGGKRSFCLLLAGNTCGRGLPERDASILQRRNAERYSSEAFIGLTLSEIMLKLGHMGPLKGWQEVHREEQDQEGSTQISAEAEPSALASPTESLER